MRKKLQALCKQILKREAVAKYGVELANFFNTFFGTNLLNKTFYHRVVVLGVKSGLQF